VLDAPTTLKFFRGSGAALALPSAAITAGIAGPQLL
jgi:hypothetical protein